MGLIRLGCPSCGGGLALAEGERVVACRYCGAPNLVLVPGAIPRYAVSLAVTEASARERAQAALRRPGVPQTLRHAAGFTRLTLCYVPFYEATAVRLGTIFLREREKPPAPLGEGQGSDRALQEWLERPADVREETRVLEQDVARTGPACALPELGVERISLAAARRGSVRVPLEPFDPVALQGRAVVYTPSIPPERFDREFTLRIPSAQDRTEYAEQALKLLYYPLWRARYRWRGRAHEVVLDGVSGRLLAGTAPRAREGAAALAAGGVVLAALGAGRILRGLLPGTLLGRLLSLPGGEGGGPALILLGLSGGLLAWLGWRWLAGGEELLLAPEGE